VLVVAKRDLLAPVRRPNARALDTDATTAERDLPSLVAVTDRDPVRIMLAVRPTTSS
jgi:hypothetical protein